MGTRRLLWLLGVTFALVMIIQFSEIPKAGILSSLLSAEKLNFFGKWNFGAKTDIVSGTAANARSTHIVEGIANEDPESPSDGPSFHDLDWRESSDLKDQEDSASSSALEKSRAPKPPVFPKIVPKNSNTSVGNVREEGFSSSTESNVSSGPVSESFMIAFTPNVSSPIAPPIILDSITPVVSEGPSLSSLHNYTSESPPKIFFSLPHNYSSPPVSTFLHNKSELPALPGISISEMNELLLQSISLPQSVPPKWNSTVDQELRHAKSYIQEAQIDENDAGFHAHIYRNISMFRRSYELMEETLKVYIYKEGERPIFHQPVLKGVYASEGWFMKLLKSSKQFVTENPQKAHLFYLPFSSRNLEETLYVPDSHSDKNLIEYLNDYLQVITTRYQFWNRTGGADHFIVACHDWAPEETRKIMARCIRALCNANAKEGFIFGKDVSLPETNVRQAQNPLRQRGGNPPSERRILAFFAGRTHGYLRPILLKYWENKDPDMIILGRMRRVKGQMNYVQHMKSSKFCICAKGYEVNSPRVVEAIFFECVPVIISDNFVPPFFEILNWESFTVFVSEKDIPNLKNILLSIPEKKYLEMQRNVRVVQQHFLWHTTPVKYDLFHMILHSIWYNRVFQVTSR